MKRLLVWLVPLLLVAFLAFYKLSETPPTWMDEGVITQVARNIALGNGHEVQIAPGEYASGSFISTAYPVTVPVALSFKLFGIGILQARIVMAIFIILLFLSVYLYFKNKISGNGLLLGILLLVAIFGPIYGHGKNVLGEIPGMFYLMMGLIFLEKIYQGHHRKLNFILSGLFLGLAIVTKPIFILIAPAVLAAIIAYRKKLFGSKGEFGVFASVAVLPVIVWLIIQFQGDTLHAVLQLYTNPNATGNLGVVVVTNIKKFLTELQPLYTLVLFIVWSITFFLRHKRKHYVGPSETVAWSFSLLILLAFLRTAGFYRYFFEAEFLSLVFVLYSVGEATRHKYSKILISLCFILVAIQTYQTIFNSWVITHTESKRSELLTHAIGKINPKQSILFYQVPEAVNFLKPEHTNYYQYVKITDALSIGDTSLDVLKKNPPDLVIASVDQLQNPLFEKYNNKEFFDRYVIFSK